MSAAVASTCAHKHPLLYSLTANAFWPQLQTKALIFATPPRSGNATGDPPKKRRRKRSPTLAANKRRANRLNKCSKRKSTATRPDAQESERHFYWIAHGQTNAGFIEQVDATYRAISADEQDLGTFGSLKAAADAVSARYAKGSHTEPLELLSGGAA